VVVDRATIPLDPIAPKKSVLMILFFSLGMAGGVGLAIIRRSLMGIEDHRIIETRLGLPVLVTIPHSEAQKEHDTAIQEGADGLHLLAAANPTDLAVESLRSLRTTLNFSIRDAHNQVVMISGPAPMIGKSFVSVNFATVLAQAGTRVLLVDADLRRGNLHRYFGLKNRLRGLSEVISGQLDAKAAIQETEIPGLDFVSTGLLPPNPSELLLSPRFAAFIEEVSGSYDFVVVDAPPVLPVTDATIIAASASTIFLVAKFGQHALEELRAGQQRFESHGFQVNGYIFNDIKLGALKNNYRYGHYMYHYGYKK